MVGYADFCGVRVRLRPGVFVPRVRSQLLVRLGIEAALRSATPVVVDLCCGSGALGAAVASGVPAIELHAADLEPAAVACARDNLAAIGGQVSAGDLFAALPVGLRGRIDVLLANVPYVRTEHIALLPAEARLHEPMLALDGGSTASTCSARWWRPHRSGWHPVGWSCRRRPRRRRRPRWPY